MGLAERPVNSKTHLPKTFRAKVTAAVGLFGAELKATSRRVIQMHDAGYFSIFNTCYSHLVWDQNDERCRLTLPDWDAGRMIRRRPQGDKFTSFCYAKPTDANLWTNLYEPLFGLTTDEMNSEAFLLHSASEPDLLFNELREPLLTYIRAYRFYRSPGFAA